MGHIKGCLGIFVVILILGIVVQIFRSTWPVCVPASIAAAGWLMTRKSPNLILNAIHALLGPVTIGLLIVSTLLLIFNQISTPAGVISHTERALVFADNKVPSWTKLSPLGFFAALFGLTGLAYWRAHLKSVTRFFQLKTFLSRGISILGAATSFSFFTNVAIVQPRVPNIYLKIDAVYRHSKEGQEKAIDRFLAARAVQRALTNPTSSTLEFCNAMFESIAGAPMMDSAAKRVLASYNATELHQKAGLSGEFRDVSTVPLSHGTALSTLDEQLATEKAANGFAEEAVKAAKESLNFGNDALKEVGWSFLDELIGEQAAQLSQFAKPLADKILDKYFEHYTEPIIERQAEVVRGLFRRSRTGFATAQAAAKNEVQAAMALMSQKEAELAQNAAHKALDAAHSAKSASDAGDTDAADGALSKAEEASAQATRDANLAKTSTTSLSHLTDALKTSSTQTQIAIAAVGAADAAKALRNAAEVEEAIKTAKAAAQILEDAKAARSAAEAAEAAKALLRVIPK
jgi:hypothetical protein